MIQFPVNADIVKLIKQQVSSLQVLAIANQVNLKTKFQYPSYLMKFYPETLITDFVHLLSKVIIFSPQDHQVIVSIYDDTHQKNLFISILANGSVLPIPRNALAILENEYDIEKEAHDGTRYILSIPIENEKTVDKKYANPIGKENALPDFYKKFRKQLKTHITTYQNLEKRAEEISEKDGILLKKINTFIISHLDDETFDTSTLSKALALSRTQLYRKLKPLIRQSPGKYIRFVRLQKAKELLSGTDLQIGDIGDQVGFPDQSHFTRAFKNQYGYNPSYLRENHQNSFKPKHSSKDKEKT